MPLAGRLLSFTLLAGGLFTWAPTGAAAQTAGAPTEATADQSAARPAPHPSAGGPALQVDFTLVNAFDGNISREVVPRRSYGLAPGIAVRYAPRGPVAWRYDAALNEYTGTDRWDRLSHGLSAVMDRRRGRWRSETRAEGAWKVPSDDREITRQAEVFERLTVELSEATRLEMFGAYRYKYYVEHAETSGSNPYAGARLLHRFGQRHVGVGYRFQTRQSRARSDRFRRHGYALGFSTPVARAGDTLAIDLEYRPQLFGGLVPAAEALTRRRDRRIVMSATYQRSLNPRVHLLWLAGYQQRWSNDPSRRYADPTLALTLRYRWR